MTNTEHNRLAWYYSSGQALFEEVVSILKNHVSFEQWERERFSYER